MTDAQAFYKSLMKIWEIYGHGLTDDVNDAIENLVLTLEAHTDVEDIIEMELAKGETK